MELTKAAGCMVALLILYYYSLEDQEMIGTKASHSHTREKRAVTESTIQAPTATPSADPVEYEIEVELLIPVSSFSLQDQNLLRTTLSNIQSPLSITSSVQVLDLNLTTICSPSPTGDVQCQCEEQFAWPCDTCDLFGVCGNVTGPTCECINGNPTDGQFCQPVTSIDPCQTSTTVATSTTTNTTTMTTAMTTTMTTAMTTTMTTTMTTAMTTTMTTAITTPQTTLGTTPNDPVEYEIEVVLRIPVSSFSLQDQNLLRTTLSNIQSPLSITSSVQVLDLNLTTICSPSPTGDVQCQCEEQFAWPCDTCDLFGVCGNVTGPTCECVNGLPTDGQFCQPITTVDPCPTPTPVMNTTVNLTASTPVSTPSTSTPVTTSMPTSTPVTTSMPTSTPVTTSMPTSTPVTTSMPTSTVTTGAPVNITLVLDLRFPVSSSLLDFLNLFSNTTINLQLPFFINPSLQLLEFNVITTCSPSSTGDLQCQCAEQFAWPCDRCDLFGSCNNVTGSTCECINGLPADGQFCEPITSVDPCPTQAPETTTTLNTTTPMMTTTLNTTTPMMTTTLNTTTPMMTTTLNTTTPMMTTTLNTTTPMMTTTLNTTTPMMTPTLNTTTPMMTTTLNTTTPMLTTTLNTTTPMMTTTLNTTTMMTTTSLNTTLMKTSSLATSTIATTITTTPSTTTTMTTIKTTPLTTQIMTTPTTMATPATTTIMSTTLTTAPVNVTERSFTLDLEFDEAFNNPEHEVYIASSNTIKEQCREHIPNLISDCEIIRIRSGSTIVDYSVRATSFQDSQLKALQTGVDLQLSETFPVITNSTGFLQLEPTTVILEERATVTCGPPPKNIEFGTSFEAEWRLNDRKISPDSLHIFSSQPNGVATLTVTRFFSTDNGQYECRLKAGNKIVRERANRTFTVQERPVVNVQPVSRTVHCDTINEVSLQCSVNSPYQVQFVNIPSAGTGRTINHLFSISNCENKIERFTCQVTGSQVSQQQQITLQLSVGDFACNSDEYGTGAIGDRAVGPCAAEEDGQRIAECQANRTWTVVQNNCVLRPVRELLEQSEFLNSNSLPDFLDTLSNVTVNFTNEVVESPNNINAIVEILSNVANASVPINRFLMEDILTTAGVLTTDGARDSWNNLNNANNTGNTSQTNTTSTSSTLLQSLETITSLLVNESFSIATPSILLNKTTFNGSFNADFNSSVEIEIPEADEEEKFITVLTFASMDNVLPARDQDNSSDLAINGRVVLVQSSEAESSITNISFTFEILNTTLLNPQCVFWNFSLFDGLGGWDDEGCQLIENGNETVTCSCNHLTSFSMLMSPFLLDCFECDVITYVGVAISMASLVICLIIEAVIWRKIRRNNTSYLRHVSIVNIAVSLLIADIWFIIGASITERDNTDQNACSAATFFIHLFYLALFFWMLASALLLIYRTVSVFEGGLSKKAMLAIGFCLGYGAPIIIAVITIAVTAPRQEYIQENVCWLNYDPSRALLAFVIPALTIVVINFIILLVVIFKMLRRRAVADSAQAAERNVLLVIVRSLAVLTPFFGLTWGLGVGTMVNPYDRGIHIAFAFFNSLQGFFILVFGTLLDKKVRSEITIKSQTTGSGTRSTSAGHSSSGGLGFLQYFRRGRDGYHVSSTESGVSQSFSNS